LNGCLLRYFIEFGSFGASYIKVVEDKPVMSVTEMQSKESSVRKDIWFTTTFKEINEKSGLTRGTPLSKAIIWQILRELENGTRMIYSLISVAN